MARKTELAAGEVQAPTKSVIPAKYRERYGEAGNNGDAVARRLTKLCFKDGCLDARRLERIAKANGVWDRSYLGLNSGLRRMTVGNRLRARARLGARIVWAD